MPALTRALWLGSGTVDMAVSSVIAGCTVAGDGTATNKKNITTVVRNDVGLYRVTLTANTATKYAASGTPTENPGDDTSIQTTKVSATVWDVTTYVAASQADLAFSFLLFSLD